MYNFAVDEREHAMGAIVKRVPVEDGDIRVLSRFQRSDAAVNADNLGGIARDGTKGGLHAETFAHGETRLNG